MDSVAAGAGAVGAVAVGFLAPQPVTPVTNKANKRLTRAMCFMRLV